MFRLELPRGRPVPLVLEIPHAGTVLPVEVRDKLAAAPSAVQRDADAYVDELFAGASARGATVLVSELSRYVVDLNRNETDVDGETVTGAPATQGSHPPGVVWRETAEGQPSLRRPLTRVEFEDRLARYYRPYHRALEAEILQLREAFGCVVLLAAHSMPSRDRGSVYGQEQRADVVPGTRGRTTASEEIIHAVDLHFRSAGLRVVHDDPYRGGATTTRWGRPAENLHAVQIELNRALYMDEASGRRRGDAFRWLAQLCETLVTRIAEAASRP